MNLERHEEKIPIVYKEALQEFRNPRDYRLSMTIVTDRSHPPEYTTLNLFQDYFISEIRVHGMDDLNNRSMLVSKEGLLRLSDNKQ